MKVGDSIKKRMEKLNSMSTEELLTLADEMLEDAKNKDYIPCKPPKHLHCPCMQPEELFRQVDELYNETIIRETEIFKILPVLHRFEKDLL